jgi:hypothetical protein
VNKPNESAQAPQQPQGEFDAFIRSHKDRVCDLSYRVDSETGKPRFYDHVTRARWESWQAARAGLQAAPQVPSEIESRAMFVARLENMFTNGERWLTIQAVLALLNDCDLLASRATFFEVVLQKHREQLEQTLAKKG